MVDVVADAADAVVVINAFVDTEELHFSKFSGPSLVDGDEIVDAVFNKSCGGWENVSNFSG